MCNGLPALRVDDIGFHAVCCNTNLWTATKGAHTVFIDGKPAHRKDDEQRHCGGLGKLIEGSTNVIVEDGMGGGGAGGAGGGAAGQQGGGGGGGGAPGGGGAAPGGGGSPGDDPGAYPGGSDGPPAGPHQDQPDTPIEPDEIEVRVVSSADEPVDGARYELTMPDGSVRTGFADAGGVIKLTGLDQRGDCTIVFPDVDEEISDAP